MDRESTPRFESFEQENGPSSDHGRADTLSELPPFTYQGRETVPESERVINLSTHTFDEKKGEWVPVTAESKGLFTALSESGREFFASLYEKVQKTEIVQSVVDRYKIWDGEKLARRVERKIKELRDQGEENHKKGAKTMEAFKAVDQDMRTLEDAFRAIGKEVREKERANVEAERQTYFQQFEAQRTERAQIEESLKRRETEHASYREKVELARGRIDGRLGEKMDANSEAIRKFENERTERASLIELCDKNLEVLKTQEQAMSDALSKVSTKSVRAEIQAVLDDILKNSARYNQEKLQAASQRLELEKKISPLKKKNAGIQSQRDILFGRKPEAVSKEKQETVYAATAEDGVVQVTEETKEPSVKETAAVKSSAAVEQEVSEVSSRDLEIVPPESEEGDSEKNEDDEDVKKTPSTRRAGEPMVHVESGPRATRSDELETRLAGARARMNAAETRGDEEAEEKFPIGDLLAAWNQRFNRSRLRLDFQKLQTEERMWLNANMPLARADVESLFEDIYEKTHADASESDKKEFSWKMRSFLNTRLGPSGKPVAHEVARVTAKGSEKNESAHLDDHGVPSPATERSPSSQEKKIEEQEKAADVVMEQSKDGRKRTLDLLKNWNEKQGPLAAYHFSVDRIARNEAFETNAPLDREAAERFFVSVFETKHGSSAKQKMKPFLSKLGKFLDRQFKEKNS